jgi:dipeptidase
LWRFFNLTAPSLKLSPETPNMDFPFSVKPDKLLSVQDVMNMTRDRSRMSGRREEGVSPS